MDNLQKIRSTAAKFARLGFTVIASKSFTKTDAKTGQKILRLKQVGAGNAYKHVPEHNGGVIDFGIREVYEFAAKVGGDFIVFDVDVKSDYQGEKALQILSKIVKYDFFEHASIITRTPSGGIHLYFRLPRDEEGILCLVKARKTVKNFPTGLEVFCGGNHCIHLPDSYIPPFTEFDISEGEYVLEKGEEVLESGDKSLITMLPLEVVRGLQSFYNQGDERLARLQGAEKVENDSYANMDTVRTVLSKMAPSIQGQQGDEQMFIACCECANYGLSKEEALPLLAEYNLRSLPRWSAAELEVKLNSAYSEPARIGTKLQKDKYAIVWIRDLIKEEKFALDSKGKIAVNDYNNMYVALMHAPITKNRLAYNVLTSNIEYDGARISKVDINTIRVYVIKELNLTNWEAFDTMLLAAAREMKTYNPVEDYMKRLPEWDKESRIEKLFSYYYGLEDSPFLREVSRLVSIALVAKPVKPSTKLDYMIILPGLGNIGKSTFIASLAAYSSLFYCGPINIKDPGRMAEIGLKQVVEWQELVGFGRFGLELVKQFLTTESFEYRRAYEKQETLIQKTYVLFGTTNHTEFLANSDRRFLVLPRIEDAAARRLYNKERITISGVVLLKKLVEDLPQIFAEVYQQGLHIDAKLCLSSEAEEAAREIRDAAVQLESFEQRLCNWLHGADAKGNIDKDVSEADRLKNYTEKEPNGRYPLIADEDLFYICFNRRYTLNRKEGRAVQRVMSKYRFSKKRAMNEGSRSWYYSYDEKRVNQFK